VDENERMKKKEKKEKEKKRENTKLKKLLRNLRKYFWLIFSLDKNFAKFFPWSKMKIGLEIFFGKFFVKKKFYSRSLLSLFF